MWPHNYHRRHHHHHILLEIFILVCSGNQQSQTVAIQKGHKALTTANNKSE